MVTSLDKESLRRKYAEERDKRLRPDGNDQYLRLTGELAHYLDTHLVDTDGKGVARITSSGVVAAGREYELDCIIYGSGFERVCWF